MIDETRPIGELCTGRKRTRGRKRAEAERLVRLAAHLPEDEGELIRVVFESGVTASELARVSGGPARTMQRRLRDLTARVSSPLFDFVAHHRDEWPPLRRVVGESVVLRGQSMRRASKLLGVSLHQVRRELERIRVAAELMGRETPKSGNAETP